MIFTSGWTTYLSYPSVRPILAPQPCTSWQPTLDSQPCTSWTTHLGSPATHQLNDPPWFSSRCTSFMIILGSPALCKLDDLPWFSSWAILQFLLFYCFMNHDIYYFMISWTWRIDLKTISNHNPNPILTGLLTLMIVYWNLEEEIYVRIAIDLLKI